jgi:hypothetical protein
LRPGIEVGQQSGDFLLVHVPGCVLAQGGCQPFGNLGVFQGLGGDDGADDDLSAGVAGFLTGFEPRKLSLRICNLLVDGAHHFAALLLVPVVLLSGMREGCKTRSAHLYKRCAFVWAREPCVSLEPLAKCSAEMAIYHLRATMISRSAGRSATAAAAYRVGERIEDHRTGLTFDYRARGGVDHVETLAPANAPAWVQDRAALWNAVEAAETRKNSQVAREIRVALPAELDHGQRVELVREFCQRQFVDRGMVADIALHAPGREGDDRNHHAHILLTTREIGPEGFGAKNRDWNAVEMLEGWREAWARDSNRALERCGHDERIDHRTLEAQRIEAQERATAAHDRGDEAEALRQTVRAVELDRDPLPQLSAGAWQMKERGIEVAAVRVWREVKAQAAEVARVAEVLAGQPNFDSYGAIFGVWLCPVQIKSMG